MSSLSHILFQIVLPILSAILILWVCLQQLKKADEPKKILIKAGVSLLIIIGMIFLLPRFGIFEPLMAMGSAIGLGLMWSAEIGSVFARPLTGVFLEGDEEPELRPFYSIAQAKRKQGKHAEALAELRLQLKRFPNDYQGMMLLAEIYADELHDLNAAVDTLEQFLAQDDHPPDHVCYALNTLADWQIKYGIDTHAARAALERITTLYPDTGWAHKAFQRLAHLGSQEALVQKQEPRRIALRSYEKDIGIQGLAAEPAPVEEDPAALAAHYVQQLELHPRDNDAREQLALIYARHFGKLELARDQLEQLISFPNQQQKHVVHWLGLLATLQVELTNDESAVRATLQRIADLYPGTAAATQAKARLERVPSEFREKEKSQAVKLGSYERDLGLKKNLT